MSDQPQDYQPYQAQQPYAPPGGHVPPAGQPPQGYAPYGYQGYYQPPRYQNGSNVLMEYLTFRRMITTVIIQFVFWLAVAFVVVTGLLTIANGQAGGGLLVIIFGPIVVRIYCELLIIIFRINDTLTDIKNALTRQS